MMVTKFYALIWLFVAVAALAAYVTDSFNSINLIFFAFLISTLFFLGIFGVLPALMEDYYSRKRRAE